MRKRVVWIDIVKGLGILTVITAHTGFLPFSRITGPLLGPWMLPIFAYTGGHLINFQFSIFNPPAGGQTVRKKAGTLIVPYLYIGFLSFLLWVLYLRTHYPQMRLATPIEEELGNFLLGKGTVFSGPLWFLPTYFIALFLTYKFITLVKKKVATIAVISLLLLLSSLVLMSLNIRFPFSLDIAIFFSSLMMIAFCLKDRKTMISPHLFLIVFSLFIISSLLNGTTDLNQRLLGNPILYGVSSIAGIYTMLFLSYGLERTASPIKKLLVWCGKNSLFLLIIHWPLIQWATLLLKTIGVTDALYVKAYTLTTFELPPMAHLTVRFLIFMFLSFYLSVVLLSAYAIGRLRKIWYDDRTK